MKYFATGSSEGKDSRVPPLLSDTEAHELRVPTARVDNATVIPGDGIAMPIRPELRQFYPPHWRELSSHVRFERVSTRNSGRSILYTASVAVLATLAVTFSGARRLQRRHFRKRGLIRDLAAYLEPNLHADHRI